MSYFPDPNAIDPQTGEPYGEAPAVLIEIYICKCRGCGHSWTNSQLLFREGQSYSWEVTPAREAWLLKHPELVEGRHETERHFPVCHRCVTPGIGKGWKTSRGEAIRPVQTVRGRPVDENGFVIMERPDLARFFETTMPKFKSRKNSKHLKPTIKFNLLED